MNLETWHSEELGRDVWYRPETEDITTIDEVFSQQYHIPPKWKVKPKTILDCGANIGLTMAHYRHLWPEAKIIGVELDAENTVIARMNTPDPVICGALQHSWGIAIYKNDSPVNAYSLDPGGDKLAASVTLSDISHLFDYRDIDFIKMDIEGTEMSILGPGSFVRDIEARSILVETHFDYGRDNAARDLQRNGFRTMETPHPRAVYAWRGR